MKAPGAERSAPMGAQDTIGRTSSPHPVAPAPTGICETSEIANRITSEKPPQAGTSVVVAGVISIREMSAKEEPMKANSLALAVLIVAVSLPSRAEHGDVEM